MLPVIWQDSKPCNFRGVVNRLQQNLPAAVWNFDEVQLKNVVEAEAAAPVCARHFVFDDSKLLLGRMTSETGDLVNESAPEALEKLSGSETQLHRR